MNAFFVLVLVVLGASAYSAEPVRRFVAVEERVMERAKAIPIENVEWKDTTLADALEFLRGVARAHDPKHEGIPIEMHAAPEPMILAHSKKPKPAPAGGWPIYEPLKQRITVSLHKTSLAEALRYATALANLRVVPSRTALTIESIPASYSPLITHTIPLAAAPKAEIEKIHADPKQYFTEGGAVFGDNSTFSFEDGGTTLVVTSTLDQIEIVHAILEGLVSVQPARRKFR